VVTARRLSRGTSVDRNVCGPAYRSCRRSPENGDPVARLLTCLSRRQTITIVLEAVLILAVVIAVVVFTG